MNSSQNLNKLRSTIMNSRDLYPVILDFLSVNDQAGIACTNRFTLATLNQAYQNKLKGLSETKSTAGLPELHFPLSAFVVEFASSVNTTPQKLINELSERKNKPDGYGATPIITVCEKRAERIVLFNSPSYYSFKNSDYKLLNILVSACSYDINYNDKYSRSGLQWIMERYDPETFLNTSKEQEKMARFFLSHPKTSSTTVTAAFFAAASNRGIPRDKQSANQLSLIELLETKKVKLDQNSHNIIANRIPYSWDNVVILINLLKKYHIDIDFLNIIRVLLTSQSDRPASIIQFIEFSSRLQKINFADKNTDGKRLEDETEQPVLKTYLKAQRILETIQEEKFEFKSKMILPGVTKNFGFSKTDKINALLRLIVTLRDNILSYTEINLTALEKQHPALLASEMKGILEPLKRTPDAPRSRVRRLR